MDEAAEEEEAAAGREIGGETARFSVDETASSVLEWLGGVSTTDPEAEEGRSESFTVGGFRDPPTRAREGVDNFRSGGTSEPKFRDAFSRGSCCVSVSLASFTSFAGRAAEGSELRSEAMVCTIVPISRGNIARGDSTAGMTSCSRSEFSAREDHNGRNDDGVAFFASSRKVVRLIGVLSLVILVKRGIRHQTALSIKELTGDVMRFTSDTDDAADCRDFSHSSLFSRVGKDIFSHP